MRIIAVLIILAVEINEKVNGEKCIFPIEMPSIEESKLKLEVKGTTNQPIYTAVLRSQFPIVDVRYSILETRTKQNVKNKPGLEQQLTKQKIEFNKTDTKLSLYYSNQTLEPVEIALIEVEFDIVCTRLTMTFAPKESESTLTPFRPGRILRFNQPGTKVKSQERFTARFTIESYDKKEMLMILPTITSYRTDKELYNDELMTFDDENLPIDVENLDTSEMKPTTHDFIKITEQMQNRIIKIKLPDNIRDIIIRVDIGAFPSNKLPFKFFSLSFSTSFQTNENTEPMVKIERCQDDVGKMEKSNLLTVIDQYTNIPPCLKLSLDANPMPNLLLFNNRSVAYMERYRKVRTPFYQERIYYFKPLAADEIQTGEISYLHKGKVVMQKILIHYHEPIQITIIESRKQKLKNSSTLKLKCIAKGVFNEVGLYKASSYEPGDSEFWTGLDIRNQVKSGEILNLETNVNSSLLEELNDNYDLICGAKGRAGPQYQIFNLHL